MPRRDDDDLDEAPSEEDLERFGDATVTCPSCGATLYDDVAMCYKCGRALTRDEPASPKMTAVIVILLVLVLTGAAAYMLRWF